MSPSQPPTGIVRSIKALRARVDAWRAAKEKIAFVPTMGALHAGHLSLGKIAAQHGDRVVFSIFVNPKQFAAHEDLGSYPRQEAADLGLLQEMGCDLVYCPPPEEIYPPGYETSVTVGAVGAGLESAARPHFFGGVATVVLKLLNQCRPDVAIFGEKDYQQLLVVKRMVRDFDLPVTIIGGPTVREADGLAMSSRNAYLSADDRLIAGRINGVLKAAAAKIASGTAVAEALAEGRSALLAAGVAQVAYFEARHPETLAELDPGPLSPDAVARLLVAVLVGRTRLLDNWPVTR